jgi:hypothetical protein
MLALKKKQAADAAEKAAEAAAAGAAPTADGAGEEKRVISLLGGDDARKSATGVSGKKKMKPGEIRVQKGPRARARSLSSPECARLTAPTLRACRHL